MKSKKVLLGLFVGLFALATGSAMAQTPANSLVEVGPDNLGGRVRSVLVDQSDSTRETIYAGAVAGGLYYRDANHSEWQMIPCTINGKSVILPITSMVQGSDNIIYIATGEGGYQNGFNSNAFAPLGRGLVSYNPATGEFSQLIAAPTTTQDEWAVINKLALVSHNGSDFLYIATGKGLYRWDVKNATQPVSIFNEGSVRDIELVELRNMAYFTSGNQIYRLSNLWTVATPINISASNAAFGGSNTAIELAVAPSDPSYLYAMVIDENGLLAGLYLTKDQQNWTLLNTPTVTPLTYNNGNLCGAITVDPGNADRLFMAGTSIYVGEGFVENSFYQWTQATYPEMMLNAGDYMSQVFSSSVFVHSGINQILPVYRNNRNIYYIATDGGVFMTTNNFISFTNINRGLNISQVNGLAVCPDGSLISGVQGYAEVFIEARMAHNGGDTNATWYDSTSTANHLGNVIFRGSNGGQAAASMFQQVLPQERRCIFVSSESGFGRTNKDYNDFTNTQTWTVGTEYCSAEMTASNKVTPYMSLFETTKSVAKGDSITFNLDMFVTNDTNLKSGAIIIRNGQPDTIAVGQRINAGDQVMVLSRAHSYYPFIYTFTEGFVVEEDMSFTVHNPLHSRLAIVGRTDRGQSAVFVNWYPADFSKIYSAEAASKTWMYWAQPMFLDNDTTTFHLCTWSNDGEHLFATIDDQKNKVSYLVRATGFNDSVDYSTSPSDVYKQLQLKSGYGTTSSLKYDTVAVFDRMITSIFVNPQQGTDAMVVTFGGFDDSHDNVVYLKNISSTTKANQDANVLARSTASRVNPVYSSMIAIDSTSNAVKVFVGSETGAYSVDFSTFNAGSFNASSWSEYGNFNGVPVTAMCQQTTNQPLYRYTKHTGFNAEDYLFARTKYPYAMYFGTYGRGIFMDSTYVTNHENEIVDSSDYTGVPVVYSNSINNVRVYPNPAVNYTNLEITIAKAGNTVVRVFDMSGKVVMSKNLGVLSEGTADCTLNCQNLLKGMYLVNVTVDGQTATTKLVVR